MRTSFLRATLLGCALAGLLPSTPAQAHDYRSGDIVIGHPWTRAVGAAAPTAAGYLNLTNRGSEADRLVSAETPMARRVELHEMSVTDGIMRMRPLLSGILLPPEATVWLRPGGVHLMLIGPVAAFVQGGRVPLTLRFERAGEVTVELDVAAAGARPGIHQDH